MSDYTSFDDNRIKHMEMIQGVITRLAGNSFLIKGWALTLTGLFLGFAVNKDDSKLAFATLLPVVIFWGLDAYYLHAERLFRALFDDVRKGDDAYPAFFMGATGPNFRRPSDVSWRGTIMRGTLLWFYGVLLAATALVIVVICKTQKPQTDSDALLHGVARLANAIGDAVQVYLV